VSFRLAVLLALVCVPLSVALTFWWAPTSIITLEGGDVQRDIAQKIFYLHVPVALAAYLCFAAGAWNGLLHLLTDKPDPDIRSYAGVHSGVVFGTLVLITGSIWAKAAWGVWWQWGDRQLLVFLTLFLFYAAYFVLRFSIDSPRARARASAVYAVLGVALVPLSFMAIRIADTLIHPIVITSSGDRLTGEMWLTFFVGVVGMCALAIAMLQVETAVKLRTKRGYCAIDEQTGAESGSGDGARGDATTSAGAHA
jgi:heme exporter protein C